MKETFGERLRLIREGFGISQFRLANALGSQQSYVAKWEAEAYNPSDALKRRISQFFQISPAWLMDGVGPIFKGVVFIPKFIHMFRRGFNAQAWMKTAALAVRDGAVVERIAVNTDREGEAVLLFTRNRDLRLFMHYGSYATNPRDSGVPVDIPKLMESFGGRPGGGFNDPQWEKEMVRRLPENTFRLVSPLSTLEGIEKLLAATIPAELKESCLDDRSPPGTRLGELVESLREEALRALNDRDFDNSACRFLLSIGDDDMLKGMLFLVPALMRSLGLTHQEAANLSISEVKEKVLKFCRGSCGW